MAMGPNNQGSDFNLFYKATVSNAAFSTNADVAINIRWQEGLLLINEGSSVIEVSFNGNNVHCEMDSSKDSKTLRFDHRRVRGIWFRLKSGSSSVVQVQAWSV